MATGARFGFQPGVSPPSALAVPRKGDASVGTKGREKSSPSSAPSAKGGDLSELAKAFRSNKALGGLSDVPVLSDHSGWDVGSSSSLPPVKKFNAAGNSLTELIQQHKDLELPKVDMSRHAQQQRMEPVSSLPEMINFQKKTDFSQPHKALSVSVVGKENKKGPGLSLSELIAAQKKQEMPAQSSGPQRIERRTSPGSSLSEIINAQREQPAVSLTQLSSLTSSSQAQTTGAALSLSELVNRHSSQKKPDSCLQGKLAEADNDNSKDLPRPGLSLLQLVKNHSDSNCQTVPQPLATTTSQSPVTGLSLADLAKKHTSGQSGFPGTLGGNKKDLPQPDGGLSAIVKQHQGTSSNSSTICSSSDKQLPLKDMKGNTKNLRAASDLADSLRYGLILRPEVEPISRKGEGEACSSDTPSQNRDRGGKGDAGLSLVSCLKKSLTIQTAEKKAAPHTPQTVGNEEEECALSPENTLDFDADFLSPVTIAPGMKKSPSLFARCICLHLTERTKRKAPAVPRQTERKAKFPKFQFKFQTRKLVKTAESPLHVVARFDFSTTSPDDIVIKRQKTAFTRTGQQATEQ